MILLENAKKLETGTTLHHTLNVNADGTPQRWKVNGKVKRWKLNPNRIEVPLKHSLYDYDYLTEDDLHLFNLT